MARMRTPRISQVTSNFSTTLAFYYCSTKFRVFVWSRVQIFFFANFSSCSFNVRSFILDPVAELKVRDANDEAYTSADGTEAVHKRTVHQITTTHSDVKGSARASVGVTGARKLFREANQEMVIAVCENYAVGKLG